MNSGSNDLERFVKDYFSAGVRRDFETMLSALYPGDVDKLKTNLIWCSQAMARFGESTGFLEMFGPDTDVEDLRVLSPQAFLVGLYCADGAIVIPGRFAQATEFSEGLAAVAILDDELELRWGYIRTDGSMQIEPRFASAEPFMDSVAEVVLPGDEDEAPYLIDYHGQRADEDDTPDEDDE
jgi:hypothetical protein